MGLRPKGLKYRKIQKGKGRLCRGVASGAEVVFGSCGLRAASMGLLTERQIEAARRTITRHLKRQGKVWIPICCDRPVTKKPLETRMGKGKGSVEYWVAAIKPGQILFEVDGVDLGIAKEAFKLASAKLPIPTAFAVRNRR